MQAPVLYIDYQTLPARQLADILVSVEQIVRLCELLELVPSGEYDIVEDSVHEPLAIEAVHTGGSIEIQFSSSRWHFPHYKIRDGKAVLVLPRSSLSVVSAFIVIGACLSGAGFVQTSYKTQLEIRKTILETEKAELELQKLHEERLKVDERMRDLEREASDLRRLLTQPNISSAEVRSKPTQTMPQLQASVPKNRSRSERRNGKE